MLLGGAGCAGGVLVEFRVLGPVELWVDEHEYDLGSPKERCVLAVLLLAGGRPISAERLMDRVWGDDPPARESLYPLVTRLRGRLRRISGTNLLTRRAGAYVLKVDPGAVDLFRFESLLAQARAIADSGDDEQAIALFDEAEALWRGEALAGLGGDWAARTRDKLQTQRLDATIARVKARLRAGQFAGLTAELSELVAQHPFDEVLIEHFMLALYRSGRQSDALHAYRTAQLRLDDELGIQPGPQLQELHQRMLSRDPGLAAPTPTARLKPNPGLNTLPRDTSSFTGRVAELRRLLDTDASNSGGNAVAIDAIHGMPGVGKTALAVHAAHQLADQFPDGQFYIELHAHDLVREPVHPADGLETLLRILGVPAARIPAPLDERAAMLRARMANRRALLVLDDAAGQEQVRPFLPGAPGCRVLITSRRRLTGLRDARSFSLDVLSEEDATTLFSRIVGAERADDAHAVAEVVRLCGYLPLTVELAAGRFCNRSAWSLDDLAARLARTQGRLAEFRAEDLQVASTFELSYRELTPAQQQVFRCLGLNIGADFGPYAAAALTGDDLTIGEHLLEDLVEFHLVEEPHSGRFRMHDLLHEYARDRVLRDEPESSRTIRVHRLLDYYLHTADRADRAIHPYRRRLDITVTHPPSAAPGLHSLADARLWVKTELPNLLASIKYAVDHRWFSHAAQLPHVLADVLDLLGRWREAAAAHHYALDAWRAMGELAGEARALGDLSHVLYRTGGYDLALRHATAALAIYRDRGDQYGQARMLDMIGLIRWHTARYPEGLTCFQEALAIQRDIGDRHGEVDALSHSGMVYHHIGRYRESIENFQEALSICRVIGDQWTEAKLLNNIGDVQQQLGYHRDALELYQQTLRIFREIGSSSQNMAILYNNIGNVHRYKGRYDEALKYHRDALSIYRDSGDLRNQADVLNNIGLVYHQAEQYAEALIHHQRALSIAQEITEPYEQARAHLGLGDAHRENSRHTLALEHYRTALDLARDLGTPYEEGQSLHGIAETLLHLQGPAVAKAYWQQALSLFQQLGVPEVESVRIRLHALGATGA
jgi:tetratricopeptide (TPR) repeat protein/DNA-binding SARP family transcriptional activator